MIESMTREELFERFGASPAGARVLAHTRDWDMLLLMLCPAIRLAAAIERAGLVGNKALTIHIINAPAGELADQGRWLQFARAFLRTTQTLAINVRMTDAEGLANHEMKSVFAHLVTDLAPARLRHVADAQLHEPLPAKTDLVLVNAWAAVLHWRWAELAAIAPHAAAFLYESSDATVGVAEMVARRHGGTVDWFWLDAIDEEPAVAPADPDTQLYLGGSLLHVKQWPSEPFADQTRSIVDQMLQGIFGAARVSSRIGSPLMWPGVRIPVEGGENDSIFIDGLKFVEAETGALHGIATDVPPCPQDLLALHPGLPNERRRVRAEELAWAYEAILRLGGGRSVFEEQQRAFHARRSSMLAELGITMPSPPQETVTGIFRHVAHGSPEGLYRAVLHGADPDQRGPGRITPLIAAVIGRQVEVADELIELGADPSLRDAQGWSALDYAALGGDPELLRLVLPTRDAAFDERPDGVPSMLLLFCLLSLHDEQIRARRHESEEAMFPPFESMIAAWKEGRWNQEMFSGLLEQLNSQEDAFDDEDGDALTEDEEHELLEELLALEVSAEAEPPAPIPSFAAAACIDPPEDLSEHDVPADDLVPLSVDVAEPASDATAVEVVPSTPVLAPRAERDGRRQGTMAVVSTVSCRLRRAENDGPASERIEAAKAVVFDWLRTDKRLPLPATVPAEYQLDLATGSIITDATDTLWTLRFDDLDQSAPGRIWRTEVVLAIHGDDAYCSVRLVRISPASEDPGFEAVSIPRLIGRLAASVGLEDARLPLRSDFWACTNPEALASLLALLRDPGRSQPVLVMTSPDPSWAGRADEPGSLAARLAGVAHLVRLDARHTFGLTREVGRGLSVYGDAVRVYRPGFAIDDDGSMNPLLVRRAEIPPRSTIARLVETTAKLTAAHASDDDVPSFAFARTIIAQTRRQARSEPATAPAVVATDADAPRWQAIVDELTDKLAHAQAERDAWEQRLAEREAMATSTIDELKLQREGALEESDRLRRANWHLRTTNEQLRSDLAGQRDKPELAAVPIPETLDDLEAWAASHLGEDVVLTSKALRSARKSDFAEPELAYQTLLMLRDLYVPMRLDRTEERVAEFQSRCQELGIEVSGTGRAVDDHRYRDAYRVRWKNQTYKLDLHVSGSSSRDTSRTFRVYFAWDETAGAVVVGHLPTHLTSSLTAH